MSVSPFELDIAVVLAGIGVEPSTVLEGSTTLTLRDNAVLVQYTVLRAVPPHVLGMALVKGSAAFNAAGQDEQVDGSSETGENGGTPDEGQETGDDQ